MIPPKGRGKPRESQESPEDGEKHEEEMHLRKRCFRILSRQMDQAMDDVMTELLTPCLSTLEAYLQASSPIIDSHSSKERSPEPPRQKRQKNEPPKMTATIKSSLEGLDVALFDRQQDTHSLQDPLLLPVVLVQGPSFGADRRAQFACLENGFKTSHPASATIQMELPARRQYNAMQELVQKCHYLSPVLSSGGMHRRIVRRKRKKVCFFSDLLLLWASLCEFNEIVIFLNVSINVNLCDMGIWFESISLLINLFFVYIRLMKYFIAPNCTTS